MPYICKIDIHIHKIYIYITHTQRIVLFKERNTDSRSGQISFLTNQSLFTF